MQALTDAGARVYALSYDEHDALQDFRAARDITFTLLSDPDSEVIQSFGLLNTLIAADDHPWFGIPYPGTFVINRDGVITHKFFENNLAVRAGPEQLLRAVRGEMSPATPEAPESEQSQGNLSTEVSADVFIDGEELAVSVQRELVARFTVPAGRHLYASPAPAGSVAVDLQLDPNPALVLRDLIRPSSEPHTMANTDETFAVHHDGVELRLPITINGALTSDGAPREITISGTLHWQACDDEVCDIPATKRFEFTIPIAKPVLSEIRVTSGKTVLEPNAAQHFQRMIERRSE
jgi:hypothetical protein